MNQFDQFRQAMRDARETMAAADSVADEMAKNIQGRLRKVSTWTLRKLKRELEQFNSKTGKWREESK